MNKVKFLALMILLGMTTSVCVGMKKKTKKKKNNFVEMSDENLLKSYLKDSKNKQILDAVIRRRKTQEMILDDHEKKERSTIRRLVDKCNERKQTIKGLLKQIKKLEEAFQGSKEDFGEKEKKWGEKSTQKAKQHNETITLKDELIGKLREEIKRLEGLVEMYLEVVSTMGVELDNVPTDDEL